ncbi:THAP domain-containing protein 5-like [Alosa sapidissima]|uniref:THAP domain-containing protein 5-like n=1 Tax=Alosa sapidissima TaxID=34773 RepID=UPI001C0A544D|nr:THAP domain-containing protein 5-like [Alosa sapidissima]
MPRYCAVKLCKNRGGVLSKDNKRISFYPFPLRDQVRLQKWVDNMKRQEWTPSRHQYLCSEHFTEDSFDLRWGIRYLKHTAIPTIFPYICDDENNRIQNKKNSRVKGRTCDTNVQLIRSLSPPKKKPLILKDNDFHIINNNNSSNTDDDDSSGIITGQTTEVSEADGQVFSVLLVGHLKLETTLRPEEEGKLPVGPHLTQTGVPSPVRVSVCEHPGGLPADPGDAQVKSETEEPFCVRSAVTALLPCDPVTPFPDSTSGAADQGTAHLLQTGLNQSITIGPIMCLKAEDEQEGAGVIVFSDAHRGAEGEAGPDKDEAADAQTEGEGEGEHACLCEHSYSRQDLDQEQLWGRIAALHAKITELDQREEETLAKIQAAEDKAAQLRKQNVVCEEKQKALEEYFTAFLR